jgi:hypothetical protein
MLLDANLNIPSGTNLNPALGNIHEYTIFTLPQYCGIGDLPDVAAEIQHIIVRRGIVKNIG